MGKGLEGKKIAIAGSRKTEEISKLIEKQAGIPVVRPMQGTVFLAEKEVEPDLERFAQKGADWVIFTTGMGLETLVTLAKNLGIEKKILTHIREAKVASRGYKTVAALKKLGITPVAAAEDGTTKGLMEALKDTDFSGKRVMIQLHGETAPALTRFFEEKGAEVQLLLPYQHIAPEAETVATFYHELTNGEVDAVCFTTAVQVRSLFDFARKQGITAGLLHTFKEKTLAAAVGKVTAEALREEGVTRLIVPENERMGALIVELGRYYSK